MLWLWFQEFKPPKKPFLRMNYSDAIKYLKEHNITKEDGSYYEFGEVRTHRVNFNFIIIRGRPMSVLFSFSRQQLLFLWVISSQYEIACSNLASSILGLPSHFSILGRMVQSYPPLMTPWLFYSEKLIQAPELNLRFGLTFKVFWRKLD